MLIDKNFRSSERRHAREYWLRWCSLNLVRGMMIEITSDTQHPLGPFSEVYGYERCDDTHIHCVSERGVRVGVPTCFIVGIQGSVSDEA